MKATEYRSDERAEAIIAEVLKAADNAMEVDCADKRVTFAVTGWFIFPKGSLTKADIKLGA